MISLLHEQKRKGHNRIFNGYILEGFTYDEMFFLCSGGGAGGDFRRGAFGGSARVVDGSYIPIMIRLRGLMNEK